MEGVTYLSQAQAQAIDDELMGAELGFSIDQLMELAGLSVASALAEVYPPRQHARVLVLCGPGNNGGDGLVAARHLRHFGYFPSVCLPKRTDKPLYHGLVKQLTALDIPFLTVEDVQSQPLCGRFDVVVDALFGFSFRGQPRPPFDALLKLLCPPAEAPPVVSVDIPSGWDVEAGDTTGSGLRPAMLVSLTAPKLGARRFGGPHHYLGGRFVPPSIIQRYDLRLPPYPGTAQCVRLA